MIPSDFPDRLIETTGYLISEETDDEGTDVDPGNRSRIVIE